MMFFAETCWYGLALGILMSHEWHSRHIIEPGGAGGGGGGGQGGQQNCDKNCKT